MVVMPKAKGKRRNKLLKLADSELILIYVLTKVKWSGVRYPRARALIYYFIDLIIYFLYRIFIFIKKSCFLIDFSRATLLTELRSILLKKAME